MRNHHTSDLDASRLKAALAAMDWPLLTRLSRHTLRKNPRHLVANRLLGFSLSKQRQIDAALIAFRKATVHWPDDGELLANFGNFLIEQAMNAEARPLLERLCKLRPDKAVCWNELAHCYYAECQHEKGLAAAEKAAALADDLANQVTALTQKAIHRRELGQIKEAVRDCEAAIALLPQAYGNYTNRILFMLADPDTSAKQLAAAAKEYADVFEQPIKHEWPVFTEHRGAPWRKLNIGFLSPDLRGHPVMYSLEGLLAQLDRRQFEVFAFYLYPQSDSVTKRVENLADHFVRLSGKTPQEQTDTIRENNIDILVDLAGHTGNNGLLVLARKAAPVQISWLGFPATTGLSAVDYKFTDEVTDPEGAEDQYSEKLYRMPTLFACYRPHCREPLWRYQPRYLVRSTPALNNGHVTFGSCNNLGKLTDDVLSLWAKILSRIPKSRLLIEGKGLGEAEFASKYKAHCSRLGLDSDRLDLVGLDSGNQYLTYHRIDIALDPFPLTGGTTTFDLLWMGIPLVSMCGNSFKSRIGTGMLTYLGRTEWLARDSNEYIEIAIALASDIPKLNQTRLGLRLEVENSPLMREDLFCQHFGRGLRSVWLQWLARQEWSNNPTAQFDIVQDWRESMPDELRNSAPIEVGLEPGKRVPLNEAHRQLEFALAKAKAMAPLPTGQLNQIEGKAWADLTKLAEVVLSSNPHDPVALSCLAEVEFAHGHTEFAVTYLRYATDAMTKQFCVGTGESS